MLELLDNIRCWWKVCIDGDVVVIFNESFIYNIFDDERGRSLVVVIYFVVGSKGRNLGGCIIVLDDAGDGDHHFEVIVIVIVEFEYVVSVQDGIKVSKAGDKLLCGAVLIQVR